MSIKSINSQLPKVTICVPVRNGACTIQRTLDSLLDQDYPNYEIIISDNCSDDDTANIVGQYASNGVKYFFNPVLEKWGAENNWNHILTLAEGPFIALYHADDIYTPTMVRRQVEFMETHPQVSAVFMMMQMIDEKDRHIRMGSTHLPKELRGQDCFDYATFLNAVLKYGTFTPVPTMMTRRHVIDAVGVFQWEKFASASDIDLYLRMARNWGPIGVVDEPLHKYRISSEQGTAQITNNRTKLFDYFCVIDAHLNDPEEKQVVQPQSLAFYELYRSSNLLTCALNFLVQGKKPEAHSCLREALKWRHLVTAFKRPLLLVRLMIGVFFLISIYLGLGVTAGRWMALARSQRNAWQRKPVKNTCDF